MFKWFVLGAVVWASLVPDVSACLRRRCRTRHFCRPACVQAAPCPPVIAHGCFAGPVAVQGGPNKSEPDPENDLLDPLQIPPELEGPLPGEKLIKDLDDILGAPEESNAELKAPDTESEATSPPPGADETRSVD